MSLLQNANDTTMFGHYRVVATVEKFYNILERIHSLENGHVGYKKTLAEVKYQLGILLIACASKFL